MSEATKDIRDVRSVLDQINAIWLMTEPDNIREALEPHFDAHAVIVGCGLAPAAQGKSACVASYVDFKKQAQIHSCIFPEPVIHVAADTAVVTSAWDIAYTMDGEIYQESGHDVYVFARFGDTWRVVWRAMLPS